jgi:hypothetical protein
LFKEKNEIKYEEFKKFFNKIKKEVLRQEFKRYDIEGKDLISIDSFTQLLSSSINFNTIYISDLKKRLNILKVKFFFNFLKKVNSFIFFLKF